MIFAALCAVQAVHTLPVKIRRDAAAFKVCAVIGGGGLTLQPCALAENLPVDVGKHKRMLRVLEDCVAAGDDIKTVQENLGHHTAAFTLDVYGHVTGEMKRASANRMEAFIQRVK